MPIINPSKTEDIRLITKISKVDVYKEFIYTSGNLSTVNIWEDDTMSVKIYQTNYSYSGGNLTQIQTTRTSDSFVYTKIFTYDGEGNLINIETNI